MEQINAFQSARASGRPTKRTARVIMTDEARVLRELRESRGLSMRGLGASMGKSDSYISQVENGRMDVPTGEALERYLEALEGPNSKSFYERVRRFRLDRTHTERDELLEVAKRATEVQVKQILLLARTILATQMDF
jgi:transcriptional regulator with XRE-family HTH domain